MEELDESVVWRKATVLGSIKTFLEAHRVVLDLEEEGESVLVRLEPATHNASQNQRSAASLPLSTASDGVCRRSGPILWDHSVVCLSTLKV